MVRINRLFILIIVGLFILISIPTVLRAQSVLVLTDDQDIYPIGLYLEILEDADKVWTIEDIITPELAQQFQPNQEEAPNLGYSSSAFWIRFEVVNDARAVSDWLLKLDSDIYYVDVYRPALNEQGYEVVQTGAALPFSTREINHPEFLFNLPFNTGPEETIYVRLEGDNTIVIPLTIWSARTIAQNDLIAQMMRGFVYGVLAIMIGYSLFLLVLLRDRSYLYYALIFFFALILILYLDGTGHQYIWPNWGMFNALIGQAAFGLTMVFSLKFSSSFFHTKTDYPRLNKLINGLIVVLGIGVLLSLVKPSLSARLIMPATIASFGMMLLAGIIIWRQGYRPARSYVLSFLLFLGGMAIFVLMIFDALPLNRFTIESFRFGLMAMALALSFALADRISGYRHESEEAQLALLKEQQETIQLKDEHALDLEKANEELSAEFEQRTRELSFAQEQINSLFENSPLAIGTAEMDGRILTANESMKTLFGYPGEEIFKISVLDLFPDNETRQAVMKKLETDGLVQETRLPLKKQDGDTIYVSLTESILTRGDQDVLLGIVDDMTAQVAAEKMVQEQAQETAVSDERNRIARELHDSVTQTLYTTSLIAEALPKVWESHPDEARRSLEELRTMTVGALAEMRTLLLELRPGELADRNLGELLHQLTDAMTARTELPITTTIIGSCPMPTSVQIAFYRIAQEALNNISKHARAERAWTNLNCSDNLVRLVIGDNGRGIGENAGQPHKLGLKIMRERAEAVDAELTIRSAPETGTEIMVVWLRSTAGEE